MGKKLSYGQSIYYYGDFERGVPCTPSPLLRLKPVLVRGQRWIPQIEDRTLLLLFKRRMPKEVSFIRAYTGWRESGSREEAELGESRAFLRWLQRHELGIRWERRDMFIHPYFLDPSAPKHDPHDEVALGHTFAIAPVTVDGRRVKLYVQDQDMLHLMHGTFGPEEDFLKLVERYVQMRHRWMTLNGPAPSFIEWVKTQLRRPIFGRGQLGLEISF